MASNTSYDIVGLCSCRAAQYFNGGFFLDLNQFSDLPQVLSNLQSEPVRLFNWNNKQYGLPVGIALPVLGYNKKLFEQAGLTPPDPVKPMTFEEFKTLSKKLTKVEDGKVKQYALHPAGGRLAWQYWVNLAGGQVYDDYVNPTKITINTPEGIQGLSDYLNLIQEKLIISPDEGRTNAWGTSGLTALQTDKVGMAEIGPWDFLTISSKSLPIGVAPFPVNKQAVVRSSANGYGIFRGSKHSKEAWEFIKWALQSSNQLNFTRFSDIPVEKTALAQINSVIKPQEFASTIQAQMPAYKPSLVTSKPELNKTLDNIVLEMGRGRYTPAEAAAELEKQGNAMLGKK